MFVARPLAVWVCLAPFGFRPRERLFIGWVGLRGAVPIVLALFPLIEQVPDSYRFFNVAFAVVLMSLLLQGTTIGAAARLLRVAEPVEAPSSGGDAAVQGQLTLDAGLPLADVCRVFALPPPPYLGATLGDWLTEALAKDPALGDGLQWQGARFEVVERQDGRIRRVTVSRLPPDPDPASS